VPAIGALGLVILAGGFGLTAAPAASAHRTLASDPGGFIEAPGGPFLYDQAGRVVILHGVDAVEKRPPYELYPDPGKPWNFSAADARRIASLGFTVVRLGILWSGLEPGTVGANNPAICTHGKPRNPHQLNTATVDTYLAHIRQTVNLLAKYHIYTLLDMHQDVYSPVFGGDGAPPWAVCTNGLPVIIPPGRWSRVYGTAALNAAFDNFWTNDVVGDLQGQFDAVWGMVAHAFRDDPWVLGYDLFNEPFSRPTIRGDHSRLDADLECFYTGRVQPGRAAGSATPLRCPPDDPTRGLIPTIEAADPHHLLFVEPDIFTSRGGTNLLGPMNFPRLVLNFHAYCSYRSPITGNPTNLAACAGQVQRTMIRWSERQPGLTTPRQPGGPALFMSEFGATSDPALVTAITATANRLLLGWSYWSWRYYDDPTGSSAEALVRESGAYAPTMPALDQPYAQAIAGTPVAMGYNPGPDRFTLTYQADRAIRAPTIVFVPHLHYPHGYCTQVVGATVRSRPDVTYLHLVNASGDGMVQVTVTPGVCANLADHRRPADHRTARHRTAGHRTAGHRITDTGQVTGAR